MIEISDSNVVKGKVKMKGIDEWFVYTRQL